MNPRRTTLTAALSTAAAAAVCAALAGCSTHADAAPITSVTPTGTAATTSSGSSSATPSTSTSTSLDAAAQEKKDRQDAEAVWIKFNSLLFSVQSLPADQVTAAIGAVAVDPAASRVEAQNKQFRAEGKVGYGANIIYASWPKPINGSDTAVIDDCQDGSKSGYQDAKTGNKLTAGTPNTPVEVTLTRTSAGWKVASAVLIQGQKCTPGTPWGAGA